MDKPGLIRVPHEVVNDDTVVVAEWRVQEGDFVRAQDVVALIETSKSMLELEAGAEGFVHILYGSGEEVAVGEVIGRVESSAPRAVVDDEHKDVAAGEVTEVFFSKKARQAIEEHELNLEIFKGKELVREADVLALLRERDGQAFTEEGIEEPPCQREEQAAHSEDVSEGVGIWEDARAAAGERGRSLFWLVLHYVWNTWFLTNLVRWAPRFAILTLHRQRGVKIGRGCFVDPSAILETAHPGNIIIGDDVRIAANVVVMTHIKPPLYLRQKQIMSSVVKPVVFEDHCFIGVSAVVMPGVRVGKAAVVVSGAVVVGDVPPYSMVAGNPAKVVKRFTPED